MDIQFLDHVIQVLKPIGDAGSGIASKVAASALWDWIKEKFKNRSAGAAEATTDVEKAPQNEVNWEVLRVQLAKAIAEDEGFLNELKKRLSDVAKETNQFVNVEGDNNKTIQNTGIGNTINIQ